MPNMRSILAKLPPHWQLTLKRHLYARQIRRGTFATDEPEYNRLGEWIRPGDWVLDIGANVGHYTKRLSELVGDQGRVIAFEPTPATFSLLAANTQHFACANVTLINAAASDRSEIMALSIPKFESGLMNFYEAQLCPEGEGTLRILTLAVDSLQFRHPIALVKVDAEGHEFSVLRGMPELIAAYHPILIVETGCPEVTAWLKERGYAATKLHGSPNVVYRHGVPDAGTADDS